MFRFAPSPTGDMHIGNLRAALINYICARQSKQKFVLRIEDTDTARNIGGKENDIKELLGQFGISWDLYFVQSDNFSIHQKLALKLVSEGKAFACFCTKEELEAKKTRAIEQSRAYRYDGACESLSGDEVLNNDKPFVVRLKKPSHAISFSDSIKGELSFEPENIDSFVILRADKTPTYNFACAVDDMLEDISYIIRGEDHVSNTPKQEHIRASLGYTKSIKYAHLPIILNEEGKKMSKRESHSSVKWLLGMGILQSAIANYLVLLGNNVSREIFTLDEAIEFFDIAKLSKSPARFDMAKLLYINKEHIKMLSDNELKAQMCQTSASNGATNEISLDGKSVAITTTAPTSEICQTSASNSTNFTRLTNEIWLNADASELAKLARLYLEEASTISELCAKLNGLLAQISSSEYQAELSTLKSAILELFASGFDGGFDEFKSALMSATSLSKKSFFMPLRLLLTSSAHGPELAPLYECIKPFIASIISAKEIR